jgi:basic membrane protein A and related proteins
MPRLFRLLVLAVLLLPLIVACGGTGTGTTGTGTEGQPSPIVTEVPAAEEPVATEAPAVETEAPTEAVEAETVTPEEATEAETPAAEPGAAGQTGLRIGLVTDVGKLDDKSFNESAWNGTQMGAEAIGSEARAIETQDPNDFDRNINQFVSEGYDIIVTVGFALGEATVEAARANPDIHFIGVDQFQAEEIDNLTGLIFDEDKAGFLAGALAASYSQSGMLGAVLGTDLVPPVWKFGEGYRAGALHVNPDVNVQTVYHSDVGFDRTFTDPEWGKATALSMIDQGVDVVFGAGGQTGNGALFAAADRADEGVVAIGVDTDQYLTIPEAQSVLISSAMKIIDQGVADLIQQVADGTIQGGNFVGDVGLAPFHDFEDRIPEETKAMLEDLRQQLEDGTLQTNVPPAKPAS